MNNLVALLALAAVVSCNDLMVGSQFGRKVFNETIQASPAIWRQKQIVTINATDSEVISRVVVTDQRAEKDGVAKIVEGGEGHKNVSLELESPTVFRGFDFHVEVYAIQEVVYAKQPDTPVVMTKDTDVNTQAKGQDRDSVTGITSTETTKVGGEPLNGPNPPIATGDQIRKNRDTVNEQATIDPIVTYIKDEKSEVTTDNAKKGSSSPMPTTAATDVKTSQTGHEVNVPKVSGQTSPMPTISTNIVKGAKTSQTGDEINVPKVLGHEHDVSKTQEVAKSVKPTEKHDKVSTTATHTSTGDYDATTEKEPRGNQNAFGAVSQELGQKVIYGIKRH